MSETHVSDVEAPKRSRRSYADDFEAFWRAYPETRGMSKLEAANAWAKLTVADRTAATAALPAFARQLAERRRRSPDSTALHAVRYLRQRRYETLAEPSAGSGSKRPWWTDPAKRAQLDADGWRSAVRNNANGVWPINLLGPVPSDPACVVPASVLAEFPHLLDRYNQDGSSRTGEH